MNKREVQTNEFIKENIYIYSFTGSINNSIYSFVFDNIFTIFVRGIFLWKTGQFAYPKAYGVFGE